MTFIHTSGKILIVTLISVYVCYYFHAVMKILGPYNTVYNHVPGPCKPVEGVVHGSEDIQVLPNGIALITSGLRKVTGDYNEYLSKRKGQILAFDFKNPKKKPLSLKLQGFDSKNFSPHGLSIWEDKKTGKVFVYVISHPSTYNDVVEKFLYVEKDATLVHQKSITNIRFYTLNDLVVVGEDEFYATNYLFSHSAFWGTIERFALLKWGSIVYFDGKNSKLVERNLQMANGINVSPDQKLLYLAHIRNQEVVTYRILPNRDLEKMAVFPVDTNLDNLDVDPKTGDLWTGAHPIGYKVMKFMDHPDPALHTTPSQVLHIKVKDGYPVSMTEEYSDDGALLQGSSVAVRYDNAMLVGTIHNGLMYCELSYMQ